MNIKDYYNILSKDYPEWLDEFINTPTLQKQKYVSVTCGKIYTKLFDYDQDFTSLDHSIAVALVIWNFTHDMKQTLSGLFHDIATPAFKHCIDFMNGDHIKQESTEDLTSKLIKKDKKIMKLLSKYDIDISEVDNYHLYPIADNDTPKLSADRLEYSLSNSIFIFKLLSLEEIRTIYEDIEVQTNEQGEIELGFKTKRIAKKFVYITSKLSIGYRDSKTRYSMQFLADLLKRMKESGEITVEDLYNLKEKEVITRIENSSYKEYFNIWKNSTTVHISKTEPKNVYYVKQKVKVRYIDPILNGIRLSTIDEVSKKRIDKNLSYDMDTYLYLNFNF